jgi:DNA-binding GntR family transcriptional regulator
VTAAGAQFEDSPLAVLGPVARQTLQDQVYQELRRSLIHGLFDAGEVLRIRDLAARMSISTMPVREALARLISEQALEPLPNRSVRVPLLRRRTLEDLARARALIEGELFERALPRLSEADRQALWRDTEAYDNLTGGRIETAREAADLNHAFHFRFYRAAGSSVLIPIVESLWVQSGRYIRKAAELFEKERDAAATNHHHRMLDAVAKGDVAEGRAALVADINRAFDILRRRFDFDREEAR